MAAGAVLCENLRGSVGCGGLSVEQPSFGVIMLATIIIGFWSLMSGMVLVMGLAALGIDLGIEPLRLFLGHSP
jgi:hypothetical protein